MRYLIKFKAAVMKLGSWRAYLPLAIGELLLIAIGIFAALQIENYYEDKKEERELREYLGNLSQSIAGDLTTTRRFQDRFSELARLSKQVFRQIRAGEVDELSELERTTHVLREVLWENSDLIVNTSAFDAIKNSGFLNQLQGRDLEALIYDYYVTAEKISNDIAVFETATNRLGEQLTLKYIDDGFVSFLGFPQSVDSDVSRKIINDPLTLSILYHANRRFDDISKLILQGEILRSMIARNEHNFGEQERRDLEILQDFGNRIGNPQVFVNGFLNTSLDFGGQLSHGYEIHDVVDQEIKVMYPTGQDWGAMWVMVRSETWGQRGSLDFSRFSKIVLELKGETGGEQVFFSLKDNTDPDDGSESRMPIVLTADWQTLEIPLPGIFETADLASLHLVFTLVFLGDEARTVFVRKIQYQE